MKKTLLIAAIIIFSLPLAACRPRPTLTIYAPADSISFSVIRSFESQHRVNITLNTYRSPDEIQRQLANITYDLVIAPDFEIARMRVEDTIMPLDFTQIPNANLIDDEFRLPNDRFTVPYMFTTLGILYNADKIVEEEDAHTWQVLWNPRYAESIIMTSNVREGIAIGLLATESSINSKDFYEIDVARVALQRQRRFVWNYQSIDAGANMVANRAAIAVMHSHEASRAIARNPALNFVIPEEGSVKTIHSFVIPRNAQQETLALQFIDYITSTSVSASNFEIIQAQPVNREVRPLLPLELRNSTVIFTPSAQLARSEFFDYDVEAMRMYQQAWLQVRATR